MKTKLFTFILTLALSSLGFASALVDPALNSFLKADSRKTTKVIALMAYSQTGLAQPRRYNAQSVRRFLTAQTQTAWKNVGEQAKAINLSLNGTTVQVLSLHWVNNSFVAQVTPDGLRQLAQIAAVQKIYSDGRMTNERPLPGRMQNVNRDLMALPYDLAQMKMDQVYSAYPQINGEGVFVGHIDTGVDGSHPALAGKIHIFYNAQSQKKEQPTDEAEHGTHTAGTIVGTGRNSQPMGMAPAAKLISSAALTNYVDMIRAMEFMMDPDGNPNTADFPKLVSNSWNCEGAPDLEAFYRGITAWEATGILPVFSAGNAGPGAKTITKPHEHPATLAVAALDQKARAADFSSRGPAIYNGQTIAKPDVGAPGVDIVSTLPGGKYGAMSGTSMATPHVAGLIALLVQANPSLTPAQLKEIILKSATAVDAKGQPQAQAQWNPVYGMGVVNAFAAMNMATGRKDNFVRFSKSISPLDFLSQWEPEFESTSAVGTQDLTTPFKTDETRWLKLQ